MTPPQRDAQRQHAHRTVPDVAGLMLRRICSWLPKRKIKLLGDNTYGSIELGLLAHDKRVALISPIRMDANLFAPAPARQPGQNGRPRVKDAALPKLEQILSDPQTEWTNVSVPWYDGRLRQLQYCSGTALWYHGGKRPLPLRWVLVRDPSGRYEPRAFRCTDQEQEPVSIISDSSNAGRWR